MTDHYKGNAVGWFDSVELVSIPSEPVRAQALAEYLVEAADLNDPHGLHGFDDIVLLPTSRGVTHAVSRGVAMPVRTGQHRPLDNLRAAERWWFV